MRRLRSLKVVMLSALAVAILLTGEVSQAVAEGFLVAEENQMTELVNRHRAEHGLGGLDHNPALQIVARRQASRMVAAGYIYHNPDLTKEAEEAVPQWLRVGENVGVGPSVGEVEDAFLASPLHHANIDQSEYNVIGLGAAPGPAGALYFTQNYARVAGSAGAAGGASGQPPPAPTAAGSTTPSPANAGVVTTCRSRKGRRVCRTTRRRPAKRRARVRGIEIVRSEQRETPRVTFAATVGGMLFRAGDRLVWWDD